MTHKTIKRLCVNCGSSPGSDPAFLSAARALGDYLASQGMTLVYGGADVGLMGAVANAALARGGRVIGVIPQALAERVGHNTLTEQHIVETMHERKQKMFEVSDAFAVLPGGFGTIEEMFELLTWGQLGMHGKPIGLLNVNGYFDDLLAFLDTALRQRFVTPEHHAMVFVEESSEALLDAFEGYRPVSADKWIDS